MPLFEFECGNCHKSFETLVFTSEDKDTVTCPSCHSRKVEIQLSTFGIGKGDVAVSTKPSNSGGGSCCGGSCGCM